jgi:hypothetical protein
MSSLHTLVVELYALWEVYSIVVVRYCSARWGFQCDGGGFFFFEMRLVLPPSDHVTTLLYRFMAQRHTIVA